LTIYAGDKRSIAPNLFSNESENQNILISPHCQHFD